jgi:hypothetical protein
MRFTQRTAVLFGLVVVGCAGCAHEPSPTAAESASMGQATAGPYAAATIEERFRAALAQRGFSAPMLKVDDSVFPPIIYGIVDGSRQGVALHDLAGRMGPAYVHNGAASSGDGVSKMAFALNVVPDSAYPPRSGTKVGGDFIARLTALRDAAAPHLERPAAAK